jgi:hypothetical protein
MKASHWLQGAGAGIILMLCSLWFHISPLHSDLYHRLLPMNSVYWGVAVDLIAICVLSAIVLWLLDRFDPKQQSFCWAIVAAILVWRIHIFLIWLGLMSPRLIRTQLVLIISAFVFLALWFWSRSFYSKAVRGGQLVLALLGISIVWMAPQLFYMAAHEEPLERPDFVKSIPRQQLPQKRIVWVVFDELSQDQVIDHRQPGIQLPAFDRLRSESTMFTNVQPAGYYTELVLPSLLWGKVITNESSDLEGRLSVKTDKEGWQRFPASQSIFADAQLNGMSTGVAGWYVPYCRTYAAELNACSWVLTDPIEGGYSSAESALWNIMAPIRKPLLRWTGHPYRAPSVAAIHTSDYRQIMQWSSQLIANENIQFVFLHLPVPHPYGIYDRHTGRIGANGSYLDNLVLADSTLAQVRQWIAATSSAQQTTLIVCSDHSWRVPLWSKSPGWTKEDEAVSGGKFDPRPFLMVQVPQQTTASTVTQPFPAIREHDLVKVLMKETMQPADIEQWVANQRP